ncbi:unnamed protein product [Hymenolepis diminuta]|uniref:Uncharacterized protein n=1 Tax=Hymenolepis diminuta TaxID=6216 RepID=A0A564Z9B0_HYMDI|nr:unnamed protein product [Hymenolepis diminuta]
MSHVGAQIWVRQREHLPSQYTALTSDQKTDPTEVNFDTCDLFCLGVSKFQRSIAVIDPTVTSDASGELEKILVESNAQTYG